MQDEEKEYVDIFVVHVESHNVKYFRSLPSFKEVYQEDNGASQSRK